MHLSIEPEEMLAYANISHCCVPSPRAQWFSSAAAAIVFSRTFTSNLHARGSATEEARPGHASPTVSASQRVENGEDVPLFLRSKNGRLCSHSFNHRGNLGCNKLILISGERGVLTVGAGATEPGESEFKMIITDRSAAQRVIRYNIVLNVHHQRCRRTLSNT